MLMENFVTMELLKQIGWSKTRPSAHHFRSSSGQEVDFVLEDQAGRIVGIEVKSSKSVGADDFRGLRVLRELAGKKFVRGIVLHDGDSTVHFDQEFASAPISALWTD
jgi:predicted AAA+ superfamily ATPase